MCHVCDNRRRITETLQGATEAEVYGNHGLSREDERTFAMEALMNVHAQELAEAINEDVLSTYNQDPWTYMWTNQ